MPSDTEDLRGNRINVKLEKYVDIKCKSINIHAHFYA